MNMCILFGYNPLIIFRYFFQVDLSHFSGIITCIIVGTLCAHLLQFYANDLKLYKCFGHGLKLGIYIGGASQNVP